MKLWEYTVFSWCLNYGGIMFFRTKTSGTRSYLQIVENRWVDGRPKQRVIATLGRLDQLQQTGQLDARASAHFYNDLVNFAALRPPDRPVIPVIVS